MQREDFGNLAYSVNEQEQERDKIDNVITADTFPSSNALGATEEQSVASLFNSSPAALHNMGLLFFSVVADPTDVHSFTSLGTKTRPGQFGFLFLFQPTFFFELPGI